MYFTGLRLCAQKWLLDYWGKTMPDTGMEGLVKVVSKVRLDLGYICLAENDPTIASYTLYLESDTQSGEVPPTPKRKPTKEVSPSQAKDEP